MLTLLIGAATVRGSELATALPLILGRSLVAGPCGALGGAVVTVEADVDGVEARLRAGALVCPGCSDAAAARATNRHRSMIRSRSAAAVIGPAPSLISYGADLVGHGKTRSAHVARNHDGRSTRSTRGVSGMRDRQ